MLQLLVWPSWMFLKCTEVGFQNRKSIDARARRYMSKSKPKGPDCTD
jgi:hypothetical protein